MIKKLKILVTDGAKFRLTRKLSSRNPYNYFPRKFDCINFPYTNILVFSETLIENCSPPLNLPLL